STLIPYTTLLRSKQLTTFKNGATSPFWSKDGKKIIFSSYLDHDDDVEKQVEQTKEEREKERKEKKKQPLIVKELKYKSDARGFHDNIGSQLVMFDLEPETYTQLTEAHTHHGFQDISPDGNYVLFAANLNEDADYDLTNDLFVC